MAVYTIQQSEEMRQTPEERCRRCSEGFLVKQTVVEHTACGSVEFEAAFDEETAGRCTECGSPTGRCPRCGDRPEHDALVVLGSISICPNCTSVSDGHLSGRVD